MLLIVSLVSLIIFHFIKSASPSSECQSSTTIWTYLPCSFIISSSSSSSFYCQRASISLSINECTNREMIFFWHFPSGNMTITLESDNSFVLRLFKVSILKRKLIKSIYHVVKNEVMDNELLNDNDSEIITLLSNEDNECSIKFETMNEMIIDYGTFIRMTIMTNENDKN